MATTEKRLRNCNAYALANWTGKLPVPVSRSYSAIIGPAARDLLTRNGVITTDRKLIISTLRSFIEGSLDKGVADIWSRKTALNSFKTRGNERTTVELMAAVAGRLGNKRCDPYKYLFAQAGTSPAQDLIFSLVDEKIRTVMSCAIGTFDPGEIALLASSVYNAVAAGNLRSFRHGPLGKYLTAYRALNRQGLDRSTFLQHLGNPKLQGSIRELLLASLVNDSGRSKQEPGSRIGRNDLITDPDTMFIHIASFGRDKETDIEDGHNA